MSRLPVGYAVVWCRDFRLQAVRRFVCDHGPVALVDDARRQSVVVCANDAATRRGVGAGIATVQAIARCPELEMERPSPAAELAAGRLLLETALAWVPGIEETASGILTLDLATQADDHWLDGAWNLRQRLLGEGLETVVGIGETPALARIAAQAALHEDEAVWRLPRDGRLDRLDRLPVLLAEVGPALGERLALWGIRSLGAFSRLRREEVAARLGDEGVELWLRLAGRLRRPLRLAKLEELFEARHDFEFGLREREPLLFLVRRFVGELAGRVARAGRSVAAAHLLLAFAGGACHGRRLALPEPTLDEESLFRLVAGHLEAIEMRAAIDALRLRLEPTDPVASQRALFGAGLRNQHRSEETLARLRKIVGAERVGSPRPLDSHRPGAFAAAPLLAAFDEGEAPAGPPAAGPLLRRYPIACRAAVQWRDGEPLRIESARVSGVVVACLGPWKADGDWWHRGRGWDRVEWDLELAGQGLFRLVGSGTEWNIEGYYD
jgi:protein ImuB